MVLYRGVRPAEAEIYRALPWHGVVYTPAFLSTSLSASVAAAQARRELGIAIELRVRKGQKGVAYIHPFPTYRFPQCEVLLNAGTVLQMLSDSKGLIRLEVTVARYGSSDHSRAGLPPILAPMGFHPGYCATGLPTDRSTLRPRRSHRPGLWAAAPGGGPG